MSNSLLRVLSSSLITIAPIIATRNSMIFIGEPKLPRKMK